MQGNTYLAKTGAPDFPTTAGTLQPSSAGGDSVVLKLAAAAGSLSLSTSISPAVANQPLTLTATGAATGTPVTFYDGRTYLGVAFPSGGVAVLTTTLAAGIHSLWASFNDGGNTGDSKPLLLVVNPSLLCE